MIFPENERADNALHTPANTRPSALQGRSIIRPEKCLFGKLFSVHIIHYSGKFLQGKRWKMGQIEKPQRKSGNLNHIHHKN